MAMNYIKVTSSNIDQIGYDKDTSTLGVIFLNGSEYQYPDVPEDLYNDFMAASSHGKFFHENIKYEFSFRRLR